MSLSYMPFGKFILSKNERWRVTSLEEKLNKRQIGNCYEDRAVEYLAKNGYRIIARNFRAGRKGELDIIARDKEGTLVICECKYRTKTVCGDPLLAVDWKKQRQICKTTLFYYKYCGYGMDYPCRFDVIALYGDGTIRHVENAFEFVY